MPACLWTTFTLLLASSQFPVASAADPPSVENKTAEAKPIEVQRGHVPSYPRVITGKITDANGKPVSGALIEWSPDYPHDAPRESSRSGDDGTYRLEAKKAGGKYKLGVSAAGFAPQSIAGLIPGPRSAPTEFNARLAAEESIQIVIVDEADQPIPNLEVVPMTPQTGFNSSFSSVQQPEPIPGHDQPTRCGPLGLCELRQLLAAPEPLESKADTDTPAQAEYKQRFNEQGWLSLRITQEGKWVHEHQISRKAFFESPGLIRIVVPDYRNPFKELFYDGTLFGQVIDSNDEPVQEYHVTLRHRPEPLAVNDAEGRFEWGKTLDPKNKYEVRIFAKGFAPQTIRIAPNETRRSKPERIELTPHPSVEFLLLDEQTEKPIPNVTVVTGVAKKSSWNYVEWNDLKNYADGHHGLEQVLRVTSNADGRITVPEGTDAATLLIVTPGYARTVVTPMRRPDRNDSGLIPISLKPAASIHGVAVAGSRLSQQADGLSLSSAAVNGFEQMFHGLNRDPNGECLIDSLAAGDYYLSLMHSQGNTSTSCWTKKFTLKEGEKRKVPLGEMTGTLTLSGRTSSFTDVQITRKPSSGPNADPGEKLPGVMSVATISDVDGYFEFDRVEAGTYQTEMGRLNRFHWIRSAKGKERTEIRLTNDTHIDFVTGLTTPPEAIQR